MNPLERDIKNTKIALEEALERQEFERAAEIRDRLRSLQQQEIARSGQPDPDVGDPPAWFAALFTLVVIIFLMVGLAGLIGMISAVLAEAFDWGWDLIKGALEGT